MKKKYCIVFLTFALLGGVTISIAEISKANAEISKTKIENPPVQTESAPLKLEGTLERQEYQNGIIIEGEVWGQEINETLETELDVQSDEQVETGRGYQAGTPAK